MELPTVFRTSDLLDLKLTDRVVYSTEVPGEVKLLPLPEDEFKKGSVKELQAFDDFRVRILPVIGMSYPPACILIYQAHYPRYSV
jgi:hypothetical protein